MLLWLVVALGFVTCVWAWYSWRGIRLEEACILFIASAALFAVHLHLIYDKATTDHYLISGYVTSLSHHPAYSYRSGKSTRNIPESWIIEQRLRPPTQQRYVTNKIEKGAVIEDCYGECLFSYPEPPYEKHIPNHQEDLYACPISVDQEKFSRVKVGDASAILIPYFNPVQASDQVIYNIDDENIQYFQVEDYNAANRLSAVQATAIQERRLEGINAEFAPYNISVGLIITADDMYFEKLRRAWHQGKANDFVIVVDSPDSQTIRNVNILGWNNYDLKENVSEAIMALPSANIDDILSIIESTLRKSQRFTSMNFSQYSFLDVKIPEELYVEIILFQIVFFAYMIILLRFNPNTKDQKLSWSEVGKMWLKGFRPPHRNWYLHPLTPVGLCLYIGIPIAASYIMLS